MPLSAKATSVLKTALNKIHQYPDEWLQSNWIYFTGHQDVPVKACVAGTIVLLNPEIFSMHACHETHCLPLLVFKGRPATIDEAVDEFLHEDARNLTTNISYLFRGDNTEKQLWEIANSLTDGAIGYPDDMVINA